MTKSPTRRQRAAHDGLTCREVEQLLESRTRQLIELREQVKAQQAPNTARGTAENERTTALECVARIEAVARGDAAAATQLAPTTPWEAAVHAGVMVQALAALANDNPDLTGQMRAELIALTAIDND